MRLVDVHAHMDYEEINNKLDAVLERAQNNNVKAIISNGTHPESNRAVLQLADHSSLIKPALGMYPTEAHTRPLEEIEEELDFIKKQKNVVALGEVGLDKKWSEEQLPQKEELFKKQVASFDAVMKTSEQTKLPMIIHSRKAELETIELLESSNVKKVVMHCFMGKKKYVQRVIDNGWSLSIPVIVTKLQQLQDNVQAAPLAQLFTETDAPFLGPEPGPTNEPMNVKLSIEKIAQIKGLNTEETADQLFLNYQRMFL